MTKNRRIELRVSDDEYEDLKLRASQGDLTVSQYIRKGLALGDGMGQVMVEGERSRRVIQTPKTLNGIKDDLVEHPTESSISELDQATYATYTKLVKQLEAQGNPDAEEVARKRLGL